MTPTYVATVRLLLDVAPDVFRGGEFALKGGTALNLFVQDMPRLSVDIDAVFIQHDLDRDDALAAIMAALETVKARLEKRGLTVRIRVSGATREPTLTVTNGISSVKVEVNPVFRGTVLPVARRSLVPPARDLFTSDLELPVLEIDELYGGKLVAALDRQHPRDLFDVDAMFERFGLPARFIDCFVVYLAGHGRPVHEVLASRAKPLDAVFGAEFAGMTSTEVSVERLREVHTQLKARLLAGLSARHRDFLLSLVRAAPQWELMPFEHVADLPALRWKLLNLAELRRGDRARFEAQEALLAGFFDGHPAAG